jgi:hypothetical protein
MKVEENTISFYIDELVNSTLFGAVKVFKFRLFLAGCFAAISFALNK